MISDIEQIIKDHLVMNYRGVAKDIIDYINTNYKCERKEKNKKNESENLKW